MSLARKIKIPMALHLAVGRLNIGRATFLGLFDIRSGRRIRLAALAVAICGSLVGMRADEPTGSQCDQNRSG